MKWMRLLPGLLALEVLAADSQKTPGWDDHFAEYRVAQIEGAVLAWQAWDSKWAKLRRGDKVWEGTLIQAEAGSRFSLEPMDMSKKEAERNRLDLVTQSATMLRINRKITRDVKLKTLIINASGNGLPALLAGSRKKPPSRDIRSAWERSDGVSVTLDDTTSAEPATFFVDKKPTDMQSTVNAGSIILTSPSEGSLYMTNDFPVAIPIKWNISGIKGGNPKFYVFGWQSGGARGEPLEATYFNDALIEVSGPGNYLFQVGTSDGQVLSDVTSVSIEMPLAQRQRPSKTSTTD